ELDDKNLFCSSKGSNPPMVAGDIEYGNLGSVSQGLALAPRGEPPARPRVLGCRKPLSRTVRGVTLRGMFWISTIVATVLGAAVPSQSLLAQPQPAPAAADPV